MTPIGKKTACIRGGYLKQFFRLPLPVLYNDFFVAVVFFKGGGGITIIVVDIPILSYVDQSFFSIFLIDDMQSPLHAYSLFIHQSHLIWVCVIKQMADIFLTQNNILNQLTLGNPPRVNIL